MKNKDEKKSVMDIHYGIILTILRLLIKHSNRQEEVARDWMDPDLEMYELLIREEKDGYNKSPILVIILKEGIIIKGKRHPDKMTTHIKSYLSEIGIFLVPYPLMTQHPPENNTSLYYSLIPPKVDMHRMEEFFRSISRDQSPEWLCTSVLHSRNIL